MDGGFEIAGLKPGTHHSASARALLRCYKRVPAFDCKGRPRNNGEIDAIVAGKQPLPPDLIKTIVDTAGPPEELEDL